MSRPDVSNPAPLIFAPDFETIHPGETEIVADLVSTLREITQGTSRRRKRGGDRVRAASHGILRGELAVVEHLAPDLRQGVFAEPKVFPVIVRCSTDRGARFGDAAFMPRGLALKILGVDGARLPGPNRERVQDFVIAEGPTFAVPDAGAFLRNLKREAALPDALQGVDAAVSAILHGVEALLATAGGERRVLEAMGDWGDAHLLGATFFTQAPLLYGPHVAKLQVAPACPELLSLGRERIDASRRSDALREAIADFFESQTAIWDMRVQLMTSRETMPIEDASVAWPEAESPFRTVARITVPPQPVAWNTASGEEAGGTPAFSPWQGLAAHRPLGSIMRARRSAHEMSARPSAPHDGR